MHARLRWMLALCLSLAALALALWGVPFADLGQRLLALDPRALPGAALLLSLTFSLRVLRAQLILGQGRPSLRDQVLACGVGFFALQSLPLRLGEFVRPLLLSQRGVPLGRSFGALLIERLLDLFALLLMLALTAQVPPPQPLVVGGVDVLAAAAPAASLAALSLAGLLLALVLFGPRVTGLLTRLPLIGARVAGLSEHLREAIATQSTRSLTGALALSLCIWLTNVGLVALLLWAIPGLPHTASVALATCSLTIAGVLAVPTPGMLGPFEAFAVGTLRAYGAPHDAAAALALSWHAATFGYHVALGLALLVAHGLSLSALLASAQQIRPGKPE